MLFVEIVFSFWRTCVTMELLEKTIYLIEKINVCLNWKPVHPTQYRSERSTSENRHFPLPMKSFTIYRNQRGVLVRKLSQNNGIKIHFITHGCKCQSFHFKLVWTSQWVRLRNCRCPNHSFVINIADRQRWTVSEL